MLFSKSSKRVRTSLLAASLMLCSTAVVSQGQTTDTSGSGTSGTSASSGSGSGTGAGSNAGYGTRSDTHANDDRGFDWGWLGLLGLAGLKPRRDHVTHDRPHTTNRA